LKILRKSNWEIIFSNFNSEKKPIDPKFQGKTPKNIFDINGIKTSQKVIDPISQPIHPNESLKNTTTSPKFASKMSQIWLQAPHLRLEDLHLEDRQSQRNPQPWSLTSVDDRRCG